MAKVKRKILELIEMPEGINAEIIGNTIKLRKGSDEIERKLGYGARIEGKKIIMESKKSGKKEKKLIKSDSAHIRNIISGLQKKYVYKLQICSLHFPMNVSAKGKEVVIKNFLGEVKDRKAEILDGVEVKIEKDIITVESCDKEKAGQTAANIEKATKIRNRDKRIFQDGCYIILKEKGARRSITN